MTDVDVVYEELRVVTVKIPATLLNMVDRYAMNHGLYRSEVIRMALLRFLEEEAKRPYLPVDSARRPL